MPTSNTIASPRLEGPIAGADYLDPGAVAGDVDLVLALTPGEILASRAIERVDIRLRGIGVDTVIARLELAPPFRDVRQVRLRFRSAAVPNGADAVGGTVHGTDVTRTAELQPMPITVRNP